MSSTVRSLLCAATPEAIAKNMITINSVLDRLIGYVKVPSFIAEATERLEFETMLYREAVTPQSPGLPFRLPWGVENSRIQPQRGFVRRRNPFRVEGKDFGPIPRVEANLGPAT